MINYLRALFYGDSGSGKTWLTSTFQEDPRSAPVLHLNAHGQKITLRLRPEQPCVIDLDQLEDLNAPFNWVYQGQRLAGTPSDPTVRQMVAYLGAWGEKHDVENPAFKTIVIDSVTYVQRLAMNKVISNDRTIPPGNVPQAAQIQHWGRIHATLANMTVLFKELPVHLIFTTICKREQVIGTDISTAYPFIWGQGAMEIPSLLDMVGHLVLPDELTIQQRNALKAEGIEQAYNVLICGHRTGKVTKWQGVRDPPFLVVGPTATRLLDILEE